MKQLGYILVLFIFFGCSSNVTETDLDLLNGYWEIENVTFPNGKTKEYKVNPNIDFISVKDLKGFRKKVQPKFDGTYTTSDNATAFTIVKKGTIFEFHYKNEMSSWTEKISTLTKKQFSVINQDSLTYTYKRFQPIEINK